MVRRSVADTPVITELWFESILAPTRTRNRASEHRGFASLANREAYHHINPPGKQIQGFHGWLNREGFRKPGWGRYGFTRRAAVPPCVVKVFRRASDHNTAFRELAGQNTRDHALLPTSRASRVHWDVPTLAEQRLLRVRSSTWPRIRKLGDCSGKSRGPATPCLPPAGAVRRGAVPALHRYDLRRPAWNRPAQWCRHGFDHLPGVCVP